MLFSNTLCIDQQKESFLMCRVQKPFIKIKDSDMSLWVTVRLN